MPKILRISNWVAPISLRNIATLRVLMVSLWKCKSEWLLLCFDVPVKMVVKDNVSFVSFSSSTFTALYIIRHSNATTVWGGHVLCEWPASDRAHSPKDRLTCDPWQTSCLQIQPPTARSVLYTREVLLQLFIVVIMKLVIRSLKTMPCFWLSYLGFSYMSCAESRS